MKFKASYSINDMEQLSGIKAHTLRIWEKRYSLFEPDRTDTNIRYYSNDDLKRILNISQLNKSGIKISTIAGMSDVEITEKLSEINLLRSDSGDIIDSLTVGMIDLNEAYFTKAFSDSILRIGFEGTMQQVIFPFLERIGIMWQTGGINPAQEHFVSNIIRQKLIVATDAIRNPDEKNNGTVVLFLPENELHELSLLFYNYALKLRNYKTIYLGSAVPAENLARIAEIAKPDYFVTVATNPLQNGDLSKLITALKGIRSVKKVLLSGRALPESKKQPAPVFCNFRNLEELIAQIS